MQRDRIAKSESLNLSSYDLFANQEYRGIECAMYPHLYPRSHFSDMAGLAVYQAVTQDCTNRVVSTGTSWTRKVLSSMRAYAEQHDLGVLLV